MKIVVLVDKSEGNESVGNMWTETYIFDGYATLKEVISKIDNWYLNKQVPIRNSIRIQIPIIVEGEKINE